MKSKRLILVVSILAIGIGSLLFFKIPRRSWPVLVFKGYKSSATNDNLRAKFELRNTTHRVIWLCYSGSDFPLKPPFLERPIAAPPKPTNSMWTDIYSLSVGSFFMHGEKVMPGDSVLLEFPLLSGEPAKKVGVSYYFGTFSDGNDFLSNIGTPLLDSRAKWKDRVAFYWQRFRRRRKTPQRHEIWCADALSFQTGATNSSSN